MGLELAGDRVVDPGSGIQTEILDFGHLDLMLLDLLIKRTAGYTQSLGRLFYTAALLLQHSFYVLFFEVQERQARVKRRSANLSMAVEVKVFQANIFLLVRSRCVVHERSRAMSNPARP